jgi:hypothetical protein
LRLDAKLFFEFDLGAREQIFAGRGFAFGNAPRAVVFLRPKRAAGMHEQHFERVVSAPKHEQTGADWRGVGAGSLGHLRGRGWLRFGLEGGDVDLTVGPVEEAEVPLEHLHEQIHHSAEHSGEVWISWVALSTAVLAVLAAIAGLLSGKHANEAIMSQIEASDQWSYYQAKSIKAAVLDTKMSLATAPGESDRAKAARYEKEEEEIKSTAETKEAEAKTNFHRHEVLARGVTMFQIAIALGAVSALTRRRRFWALSLVFGAAGCVFLVLGAVPH